MKRGNDKEYVSQKSAAEFFSEHQQIAGFDNPGKSLFTTIREFVENSLDAAESMHALPDIEVAIVEYSELEHNRKNGIDRGTDRGPFVPPAVPKDDAEDPTCADPVLNHSVAKAREKKKEKKSSGSTGKEKEQMYYLVTCKDNGCGIPARSIGDMLGRVLSGSKHGVRQTRGKFGLGAKMALIWSKKSSGLPIKIRTAHSTSLSIDPPTITTVVLDIDIYKNEPRIISTQTVSNKNGWRGTEISVTIAGSWQHYRARVLQYFQQLAVITPYAGLRVSFKCERDEKKSFDAQFERRSDQMPPIATTILPHPKSLNNITLLNFLKGTNATSVLKFLCSDISGITSAVAGKIVSALDIGDCHPSALNPAQVAALSQTLRDEKQIRAPSAACLSPAGEYNMRLGVLKELRPRLVATFTEKAGSCEGHPFIVEAAVSVGGTQVREGINVYRFANRIPLLFETGADVVTQVATKRISWASYHIDPKKDNIGVYVSVVSTRIPFKGTSKEYIGDDVTEIQLSVRKAIQGCCQQLRVSLARFMAQKEGNERKKTLIKYIPDISRALLVVIGKINAKEDKVLVISETAKKKSVASSSSSASSSPSGIVLSTRGRLLATISNGTLSEAVIAAKLHQAVDRLETESALQAAAISRGDSKSCKKMKLNLQADESLFRIALPPTTTNGRSGNTSGYGDDSIISSSVKNWVEMEEMEDIIVFNDKSNTHDDDIMIIPSSLSQYSSSSSNSSSSSTSFQKRPHPSSSSCSMSSHVALNSLVVTDRWIQINSSSTISNQGLQAMILVPQLA